MVSSSLHLSTVTSRAATNNLNLHLRHVTGYQTSFTCDLNSPEPFASQRKRHVKLTAAISSSRACLFPDAARYARNLDGQGLNSVNRSRLCCAAASDGLVKISRFEQPKDPEESLKKLFASS